MEDERIHRLLTEAERKLEKGDYEGAIREYDRILEVAPNLAGVYAIRGVVRAKLEHYDEALVDYDTVVEINPTNRDIYTIRYFLNKRLGRDGAKEDLETMKEIDKEWVKENKETIINHFCAGIEPSETPFAVFMCGSSGSGKTEEARGLKEKKEEEPGFPGCVHIDHDAIKAMIPGYRGANAETFQSSATKGLEYVLRHCYTHNLNFILDSTFSKYERARQNVKEALKKGRYVSIVYIYQEPLKTWEFVKEREVAEKRRVPLNAFVNSYFGAFETIKRIKDEYGSEVFLNVVNKDTDELHRNVNRIDSYVKMGYSDRDDLLRLIAEEK